MTPQRVRAIFDLLDVNNDRYVSKEELKRKLQELNITADDKAIEKLIRHIDIGLL